MIYSAPLNHWSIIQVYKHKWWRETDCIFLERGRFYQRQQFLRGNRQGKHRPEVSLRPQRENYYDTQQRRTVRLAQVAIEQGTLHTPEQEITHEFGNTELPAYAKKQEFMKLIDSHRVVVVVGPTGSGKSTQIPQFLYERGYSVALTQPRIMAANNVGTRIESEIAGVIGASEAHDLVGIQTSEQNTTTERTKITVLTDGLRLAQMTAHDGEIMDEVLVVDEVHEWNANIELTVAWAKKLLHENSNLRVVLMSATVDAHALANYFADATGDIPPVLEIEGRTFPVERREEPTSTMVQQAVDHSRLVGSMLLFVPGLREIEDTIEALRKNLPSEIAKKVTILPLHAKMNKRDQDRVMQTCDDLKIIVATNVAQTSLTIPGVDLVIDSGLERRIELDEDETVGLELHPCSQAEMDQRAGRTGRDVAGVYIHTRYDDETEFTPYITREKYSTPEVLRTDVSRSVLRTASYGQDFAELDLFHPVAPHIVRNAKDVLFELGALDEEEKITGIGEYMNRFPLRPSLGRMMYEASRYSESIRMQMAGMVVSVEAGGLPRFGGDIETRWKLLLSDDRSSDMLGQLDIFIKLRTLHQQNKLTERFITDHDLDHKNVDRAMKQYEKVARRAHVSDYYGTPDQPSEHDRAIILSCIYAGMADHTYIRSGSQGKKPVYRQAGTTMEPRVLSNRSIVEQPTKVLVGTPYRVEVKRGGELQQFGIVEHVTTVPNVKHLAQVALHLCTQKNPEYSWIGDQLQVVTEQFLLDEIPTGVRLVESPEWTSETQEMYVHKSFENQGSFMKELLALKKKHEGVARRSRQPIAILTQGIIERWLYDAAKRPASSVGEIDSRLRHMVTGKLDEFVSDEEQAEIYKGAPDDLVTPQGRTIRLSYSRGIPTARGNFTATEFKQLGSSLRIPRGDEVRFYVEVEGHRRIKTLLEISQLV
jgi:ATP-dependent helicase HrpA